MGYIDFTFNGTSARDMRIKSVRVEEDIMQFPFITSADETTVKLPYSNETYLSKYSRENLSIDLQLMKTDELGNPKIWTTEDIGEVAGWLVTEKYKPLILGDKTHIIYYAYLSNSDKLQHYANGGILPITFQTNSPYGWSIPEMEQYSFTTNGSRNITLVNKSNVTDYHRPIVEIKNINAGGVVKLTNITTGDKTVELKGLYANETISMDNERELIYSDKPLTKFAGRFNYNWLRLRRGTNTIRVDGACHIVVRNKLLIVG